jgi:hypothetical protein
MRIRRRSRTALSEIAEPGVSGVSGTASGFGRWESASVAGRADTLFSDDAAGLTSNSAAAELISAHCTWLARADFTTSYIHAGTRRHRVAVSPRVRALYCRHDERAALNCRAQSRCCVTC